MVQVANRSSGFKFDLAKEDERPEEEGAGQSPCGYNALFGPSPANIHLDACKHRAGWLCDEPGNVLLTERSERGASVCTPTESIGRRIAVYNILDSGHLLQQVLREE